VDDEPVGLILWAQNLFVAKVYNIVVHPDQRGRGFSTDMLRMFRQKMRDEAVVAAEYEALPGLFSDRATTGQFQKVAEKVGDETGLPLVVGLVTKDEDL
jgi:hypothetical protein